MATVNQSPDALSLAGNLKTFKISSTESVQFRLLKGGVELLSQRYEPGADGVLEIDVKAVVFASLAYTMNSANAYVQSAIAANFIGEVDGASFPFRAVRGGVANLADTDSNWLRSHFLTWQPKVKPVTYYSPEWLTYYGVQEATIKLLATFDGGATQSITLASVPAGSTVTVNVQYASIAGRLGNTYPVHYKVWAESTAGSRLTDEQFYTYSEVQSDDEQWYLFENSLGGMDTFRAYGFNNFDGSHTHNIAEFGEIYKEYDVETERIYNKNTGYLDEYARAWLLDFFPSRGKFIHEDNAIRKIVVTDSDVKYASSDLPSAYSFSYKFADKTEYLNLIRNESEIPSNIVIPNVDSPDFTFPPRLAELPRILLTEGVLIPAFDSSSPTATVTTFGEIKQVIVGAALDAMPTTGAPGTGTMVLLLPSSDTATEPSDITVFTSKRTMEEITKAIESIPASPTGNFLRKDAEDTASEQISFEKGIKIGNAIFTWDIEAGALKISESIYSEKEVSAYGSGSAGGDPGLSGSLGGLVNVGIWADEIPTADRIMVQLAGETHWSSKLLSEIVGFDTVALGEYLTTNDYVTKTYVNEEISKNLHSHENKSILDLITQGNLDVLSHFSVVDGNIKVDANFWSTGEISAYGSGSGASGEGGLITSVFGSSGLGGSYLNTDYTNTFNAYTINLINTNLTTALGRIGALETSAPYAISANRLANVRTIWGQNFDGTANVMGNISGSWFAINDVAANPYLKLLENSNSWYLQGYQNKLYLGSGTANSLVIDSVGNAGIIGALTANRVNTISESHMSVGAYVDPASGIGAALKVAGNFVAGGNSYFMNGNVGIGTTSPTALLDVYSQVTGLPATSGVTQNALRVRLGRKDGAILDFGSNGSSGLWMQATNGTDLSLEYPILINPNGGNVLIGTSTNGIFKLDVNGNARFSLGARFKNIFIEVDTNGSSTGRDSEINCYNSSLALQYNTANNLHLCQGGGNVAVGGVVNTGDRLSVFGAFRVVGASYISSSLSVDGNSTLRGITLSNGTNTRNMTVGSNGGIQIAGVIDSFTYSLPATIGWYRVAVAPVGIERPFGQFDISWTLSSYHGAVSLTAGMMYASAPFISQSSYTNFGICITKSRIVYHTTYSGNYAYLEVFNETGKAVSLTVKGYNLYNWALYSSSTTGSIPSGYSNKEITHSPGYVTSGNVVAIGEITAYSASDARLKKEIAPLSNSLQIIQNLNPVSYKWNNIAKELNPLKGNDRDFGLIAQELELVVPELVHTIYGGQYKSIDYVKIIPHLICAIKQLKKEIDALKNNNIIHIN